jgi:hypothetical protein
MGYPALSSARTNSLVLAPGSRTTILGDDRNPLSRRARGVVDDSRLIVWCGISCTGAPCRTSSGDPMQLGKLRDDALDGLRIDKIGEPARGLFGDAIETTSGAIALQGSDVPGEPRLDKAHSGGLRSPRSESTTSATDRVGIIFCVGCESCVECLCFQRLTADTKLGVRRKKRSSPTSMGFKYQAPFVASSIAFLAACKTDLASRRDAIDSAE